MRNDARVNDHLDLLIASVSQIRQSPHRVHKDLPKHNTQHTYTSGTKPHARFGLRVHMYNCITLSLCIILTQRLKNSTRT